MHVLLVKLKIGYQLKFLAWLTGYGSILDHFLFNLVEKRLAHAIIIAYAQR